MQKTVLLCICCFGATLHAQICDENLKPVQNAELRYQPRTTRCEGFYESKIAAPDSAHEEARKQFVKSPFQLASSQ